MRFPSVRRSSAGRAASRRQARSKRPAGPTDEKSPGRVSSTVSRSAASSSVRPAWRTVAAAAASARRCRQAPAHRSCRRTTASSAPRAAPDASAESLRVCDVSTALRSQDGTAVMGAIGAALSSWGWCRADGLGRRIIVHSMNHGGAFENRLGQYPPRLSKSRKIQPKPQNRRKRTGCRETGANSPRFSGPRWPRSVSPSLTNSESGAYSLMKSSNREARFPSR